jgi:sugar phosphate isomerase/epimerase
MKKIVSMALLFFVIVIISSVRAQPEEKDYASVRIKKIPVAVQCWTYRNFTFFETIDQVKSLGIEFLQAYEDQPLSPEFPGVRFGHNLDQDMLELARRKLRETGLSVISYGVVNFDNNVESMKKVFGFAKKMGIKTIVTEPDYDDFSLLEEMVKKYDISIAIHNHPSPSKYARPEAVLERVQGRDERIGACADTGHWVRSGVDPLEALRMLEGRILDVHIKDVEEFGSREASDVLFGQGASRVRDVLAELTLQGYRGYLSIEHERKEDISNPSPVVKKAVDYITSVTYFTDYEMIVKRSRGRFTKHGWNHYGPGYFVLDEKTGVLKSQGGMGLFWYSVNKYKDFILELDFKCSEEDTNSGVFIRVPEVPVNDDYIYHSFEIQISDISEGIHMTGAVYDAEAPQEDAFNKTGEWNHFKITFKGRHIQVELNGKVVVDWDTEPRGKIKSFAREGYIGLQNHDSRSPVYFRDIYVKEIK